MQAESPPGHLLRFLDQNEITFSSCKRKYHVTFVILPRAILTNSRSVFTTCPKLFMKLKFQAP